MILVAGHSQLSAGCVVFVEGLGFMKQYSILVTASNSSNYYSSRHCGPVSAVLRH
jgi:hypothetical protein